MESKPIVLGQGFAAAQAAERDRLASGVARQSPIQGTPYDLERGDYDLMRLRETPVDATIEKLVSFWRSSGLDERDAIRQSLTLDDNYTLIQFAKRAAVRALNSGSAEMLEIGLTALAMIDETRIDPRDAAWAAGIWHHAARRQGADAEIRSGTCALATREMARIIEGADHPLDDWGHREYLVEDQIGLVRSEWADYAPTLDLVAVADQIAARVLASRYVCEITVATELPVVWFQRSSRDKAAGLLKRALGVASVHGTLRGSRHDAVHQMFVSWIAEMRDATACEQVLECLGPGTEHGGRFVVGASAGRLFALAVAGSVTEGVPPRESLHSLSALIDQVKELLSALR